MFKFSTPLAAVAAAAALSLASPGAIAAVVCNNTGFAIPQNVDGIYVNLVTGTTGTSGDDVEGFDLNLYAGNTATTLFGYPGNDVSADNAFVGTEVDGDDNDLYTVLSGGQPVGPSATFTPESVPMTNFNTGVTGGYLGVRFDNEATGEVNFGWLQMTTTSPNGFPATVTAYCYENTGLPINAGTTPVSLQAFSVN